MKYLLSILCLFVFSCDSDSDPTMTNPIYGCTVSTACNFNPEANIFDDSCEYPDKGFDCNNNCILEIDCNGECGGSSFPQNADCDGNCIEDTGCNGICSYQDLESDNLYLADNGEIWYSGSGYNVSGMQIEIIGSITNFEFSDDISPSGLEVAVFNISNDTLTALMVGSYLSSTGVLGQIESNDNDLYFGNVVAVDNLGGQLILHYYEDCQCCMGNTNPFEAIVYDDGITQNAIIKFNQPIGCCYSIPPSSNTADCFEEEGQGSYFCNYDSGSIIKIVSEDFFGTDCKLYYDSENYLLSGYEVTTAEQPDGTGQSCNPEFLNIPSENGFQQLNLSLPQSIGNIQPDIRAVPNPFEFNCCENENLYNILSFRYLPTNCIIDIYDANYNLVKTINYNSEFDGTAFWDLKNNQNQLVDSGIYIYEITSNDEKIFRNTVILKMLDD